MCTIKYINIVNIISLYSEVVRKYNFEAIKRNQKQV